MMRLKEFLTISIVVFGICFSVPAQASVMMSEIFADPGAGLTGDANNDGIRSTADDEFIEILNYNDSPADISGWSLADNGSTRHVFPSDTILSPYTFLVIFGGGEPQLADVNWQAASTGALSLNNTEETVSLFDADFQLIDRVVYGSIAGNDQSIVRFPDGVGTEFVLHSSLEGAGGALFSPGTNISGERSLAIVHEEDPTQDEGFPSNPVVPELPAFVYFGAGWASLLLKRMKNS
ncbi:MAG TPA: lamin tail domain-containing protein [Candidatus Omnitrophota bacterium]|nr:lamin tail domain-containing protein [Candidatus Omnitrophota bacterium]